MESTCKKDFQVGYFYQRNIRQIVESGGARDIGD
jgi:hypothetical protein